MIEIMLYVFFPGPDQLHGVLESLCDLYHFGDEVLFQPPAEATSQ